MRLPILALCVALMAVMGCETTPEDTGAASGVGAAGAGSGAGVVSGQPRGPVTIEALQQELEQVGSTVFFGFDEYALGSEARSVIERQASLLTQNPAVTVTIEGHCDERGTREYNLALGERRASAVKDYLVALGVSPARVATISYGEERPAVIGSNESAWARNRRGVTAVTGGRVGS